MTIDCPAFSPDEFRTRRKSIHNAVAYQRRRSSWWRSVGIWGWHDDAHVHGIVELGAITPTEFISVLRRHGEFRLRPVGIESVRVEVYRAARSVSALPGTRRYQTIKIAIEPVIVSPFSVPIFDGMMVEAMPVVI